MTNVDPGHLEILWEDPYGLAVNKPAGLLTQPARTSSDEVTLEAQVRFYLRPADPQSVYLGTVHRLDRPVSGVILWAKTLKAAHRWAEQFARREAQKTYRALVESAAGSELPRTALWADWLAAPDQSGRAATVEPGTVRAVHAVTRMQWVGLSRCKLPDRQIDEIVLEPETGRTHQLRAQAAARGYPIVGDATYGSGLTFPGGIALHAQRLQVDHPIRRVPIVVEAALPTSWQIWSVSQTGS